MKEVVFSWYDCFFVMIFFIVDNEDVFFFDKIDGVLNELVINGKIDLLKK